MGNPITSYIQLSKKWASNIWFFLKKKGRKNGFAKMVKKRSF